MALIFCPECGTQVSEYAQQCVKCAYPIKTRLANETSDDNNQIEVNSYKNNSINVSNTIVWILAFAPLIGLFFQGFLQGFITSITGQYYTYEKFWWATLGLNIILCSIDLNNLKKLGIDTTKINSWVLILVPIYLYKRADLLRQSQSYFWVWLIVFLISILG